MTEHDIETLVKWLYALPQFSHFKREADTFVAYYDELEDLPLDVEQMRRVCRSLLAAHPDAFPAPQAIRRRVLEELGVLAATWPDALMMVQDALRNGGRLADLPGPLREAVRAKGGLSTLRASSNPTADYAQLRDLYAGAAAQHDRLVLEPGGVDRFIAVCRWCEAVDAAEARRVLAWHAATVLRVDMPGDPTLVERVLADYEARFGEPARLGYDPTDGPPALPPAETRARFAALMAGLRRPVADRP